MNRKFRTGIALVMVLVMVLSLTGCKDDEPEPSPYQGKWSINGVISEGVETGYESEIPNDYIQLNVNGSGYLVFMDEGWDLKWKESDGGITVEVDGEKMTAVLKDDGMLYMDTDGTTIVRYSKGGASASALGKIDALKPESAGQTGETETPEIDLPTEPEDQEKGPTLANQWNGTWYGYQYFNDCTGAYENTADSYFACYFVIDVDDTGAGTFEVYNSWEQWASGTCQADETTVHATSGEAFGIDMNLDSWQPYLTIGEHPMLIFEDLIDLGDNGQLQYEIYLKPWGDDWKEKEGAYVYEGLLAELEQKVASGEEPPYGFTNPTYFGTAEAGSAGSESGSASGSDIPGLSGDLAQIKLEYSGKFTLSYPTATWQEKAGAINPTVMTADEKTKISAVTLLGSSNYDELKASFEKEYASKQDYSLEESLTLASYPVMRMIYKDDWFDYTAKYVVWFGGESLDGIFGFTFTVYAPDVAGLSSDEVLAILNTLQFAG